MSGITDLKTGEVRTLDEFMAEIRKRAAEREALRQPPKVVVAREGE